MPPKVVKVIQDLPELNNETCFIDWRKDVKVWKMVNNEADKKQLGGMLYLSLKGKAREYVRGIKEEEICSDTGFDTILKKLDEIYLEETDTRAFLAAEEFISYERESNGDIRDFMIHYDYLYGKLAEFDMKLPEGFQALFLLRAANLSADHTKLAKATCSKYTYKDMKANILKIFGDSGLSPESGSGMQIKSEPVYYSENQNEDSALYSGYYSGAGRGRGYNRGRGRGGRGRSNSGYRGGNQGAGRSSNDYACYRCGSQDHFVKDCPKPPSYKRNNSRTNEAHITLLTFMSDVANPQLRQLVKETLGMALLDCGCTKTVMGQLWFQGFLSMLPEAVRNKVKYEDAVNTFRFGDGVEVKSAQMVHLPVSLSGTPVVIRSCLVDNDIPLLLSRKSMEDADMVLQFKGARVLLFGKWVNLEKSSNGHLMLPLTDMLWHDQASVVLHTAAAGVLSDDDIEKKALKLHRQFAHCAKEPLLRMLRRSKNFCDPRLMKSVEKVVDSCEYCARFRKTPLAPVVTSYMSDVFNDKVAMDLKDVDGTLLLHLIDTATRYSAAVIIKSKHAPVIVDCIFRMWIAYFGTPNMFLSDNGGEFVNEEFAEMVDMLNIVTITTAAESPFSNGIVERHNAVIAGSMRKVLMDTNCDASVAVAWAVSAKNSLLNQQGYSPNQLVFGQNFALPSVVVNKLPAMENTCMSEKVMLHLQALHKAREGFIEAESDCRIKRALRHKTRSYSDVPVNQGDSVFFKKKDSPKWRGPGKVMGLDGSLILVRHGGLMYKVHKSHLLKVDESEVGRDSGEQVVENAAESEIEATVRNPVVAELAEAPEPIPPDVEVNPQTHSSSTIPDPEVQERPKRNCEFEYKLFDRDEWQAARVLKKQPKQKGQYGNWLNIRDLETGDERSLNWEHVVDWRIRTENELPDDNHDTVLMTSDDSDKPDELRQAKKKELSNLVENDVFDCVPYENQSVISSRWVITEKHIDGHRKIKARLVARGYEEDVSDLNIDSPTCTKESLRLLFAVSMSFGWQVQAIDISAAFLQGEPISREVYLKPPKDACESGYVWRLKRCIYGLNDAPRSWYVKVKKTMLDLGACISSFDNCLFRWYDETGAVAGILVSHVDDFAFAGTQWFMEKVIKPLNVTLKIGSHETDSFQYLGLNLVQASDMISIDQHKYIQSIVPVTVENHRWKDDSVELTHAELMSLKRMSGQMNWVANQTRPDLSYDVCAMSNTGKSPKVKMIKDANRALKKMKNNSLSLHFPCLGDPKRLEVLAFSDATYASLPDGSSQGGHIVLLKGENNQIAPISWQSKKLDRVTKSPLASEALAVNEAADTGYLVATMLAEMLNLPSLPIVHCFTDSKSLVDNVESTKVVSDKRLRVDVARLRQMIGRNEVVLHWVEGCNQIADSLTKRGASFSKLFEVLSESKLHVSY